MRPFLIPDFLEDVMPALNICADDLAGADLDELQGLRKVHAELEALMDSVQRQAGDDRTGAHLVFGSNDCSTAPAIS